ncbi:MAG: hypothetical protein ACE5Q6_04435 [Dehalococcoidia bacterium]
MDSSAGGFEQYQKDVEYAETHYDELLSRYPEQWAGILEGKVVGTAADVYQLIDDLKKQGIPTERVVLRHLTNNEELFIL